MSDYVVGIDLGTTNTRAAIYMDEEIKLLENAEGKQATPSFVFFCKTGNDAIVGSYAKKMADTRPAFGVYELKRLIGRNFYDDAVQNNLQHYPFAVEKSEDKKCCICIKKKGKTFQKSIEEVTAALLRKVKIDISAKMMTPVHKAVITVPAYFNHHQREATLEAAKMAGFTVLKLLNEPTAAALNYFQERKTSESETFYLVYDLGGGTFDIAILKKTRNNVEIVAVDGDSHLGGRDFTVLITDYICDYLLNEYNFDAKKEKRAMRRIQTSSEEAKKSLSFQKVTEIILSLLVPDHPDIVITLTREQFESMALHLFEKSIDVLHLCLKSANIEKKQIKDVILSGGSTRIPKIQEMISQYFEGITLNKFVNPDLCVANGASVQAALLSTNSEQKIDTMEIKEVTPLSLGAADSVNQMCFSIKRNTPIPASGILKFTTTANPQFNAHICIYEGERTDAGKNRFLGTFAIENLTPAPPGEVKVYLTLKIDQNGILTASAQEKYRDNVKEVQINYIRGERAAGDQELKNSWHDAQKNKNEDEAFLKFARKKNYLLIYCDVCKYNLELLSEVENLSEKSKYYNICKNTLEIAENLEIPDESKLDELIEQVEFHLGPLVKSYEFQHMPPKDFAPRRVHKATTK